MDAHLEVIAPGLMTTLQDLGRFGHQARGVPVAGALDAGNLRLANGLVGNEPGQGALEIRLLGPTLRVCAESIRVALVGTHGVLEILEDEHRFIPANRSVTLGRGQVFRVGRISDSAVCYLAIEGGFDIQPVYDSKSTYIPGGIGGFWGRALRAGDRLPLCVGRSSSNEILVCTAPLTYREEAPMRVVLGPQSDYFTDTAVRTFLSEEFTLSAQANRMGVRLVGPVITHARGSDINSDGIVTGAIQVPGNGQPIILLADHQTTGGYPKIATIASVDIPRVGRMAPGAPIRFCAVSVEEAEAESQRMASRIDAALKAIATVSDDDALIDLLLHNENLISGALAE